MTISSPTPPGYTMDSPNMSIMFISAHQVGLGSHSAEYVLGWSKVMGFIRDVFEEVNKMEKILALLNKLLKNWAEQGWMGRGRPIKLNLKISEEEFFPPPRGQMKQIKIQFFDELATSVKFFIRRKAFQNSSTLKQLTLKKLSLLIKTVEDVDSLELPRDLGHELKDEIVSCWKFRYLTDLQNVGQRRKSSSESFNDRRHAWRSKTFDDKHRFNVEFK
eukprot:GFUD01038082.1.p1 GENE.GFUD01038082.1~~GFUD01038082.1.p1  ORF type:complete len:218 (-),score=53.04 GFUD01038082.1:254-907(-)